MRLVLDVREVFQAHGRILIAIDLHDGEVHVGDRFRSNDGNEFTVQGVAFTAPEAWAAGRRGLQVEVTAGEVVAGQVFERTE